MKRPFSLLICCLSLTGILAAEGLHNFTNRNGTKSFQAELVGYDSFKKMVTVRRPNGRIQRFKVNLLSEKDREYVETNGPKLSAASGVRISCDMNRETSKKSREGNWEHKQIPCYYTIAIQNTRNEYIDDVSVDYTIFIERNPKKGGGPIIETVDGSETIGLLLRNYTEHVTTNKITLHEWRDNPPLPVGGSGGRC